MHADISLDGASDHGVSEARYLRDPDENGVELYWDRPREQRPRTADGAPEMFTHRSISTVCSQKRKLERAKMTTGSTSQKPFIEWRPTASRNVEVLNETADLYRYFDCTEEPEALYQCARHTLEHDLPRESFICSVTTKGPPHHGYGRDAGPSCRKPGHVHLAEQGHTVKKTTRRRIRHWSPRTTASGPISSSASTMSSPLA
jgi:hypothetical protein